MDRDDDPRTLLSVRHRVSAVLARQQPNEESLLTALAAAVSPMNYDQIWIQPHQ